MEQDALMRIMLPDETWTGVETCPESQSRDNNPIIFIFFIDLKNRNTRLPQAGLSAKLVPPLAGGRLPTTELETKWF